MSYRFDHLSPFHYQSTSSSYSSSSRTSNSNREQVHTDANDNDPNLPFPAQHPLSGIGSGFTRPSPASTAPASYRGGVQQGNGQHESLSYAGGTAAERCGGLARINGSVRGDASQQDVGAYVPNQDPRADPWSEYNLRRPGEQMSRAMPQAQMEQQPVSSPQYSHHHGHVPNGQPLGQQQVQPQVSHAAAPGQAQQPNRVPISPPSVSQNTTSSTTSAFVCPLCFKTFTRTGDVDRHHRTMHTDERPYECYACSARYSRLDKAQEHCRKKHGHPEGEEDCGDPFEFVLF